MLKKVIVVFKTHFDLGFTDLPADVMRAYTGPMFEAVRRTMEATANEPPNLRYCWTLPAWPLHFLLHDPSVPQESRQAARQLVLDNRLHWHAYPFTTHTAFCGLEDLVRGLHISRKLSEEFGRWPTGAKQTDVPGHSWILPALLNKFGVQFLHLGCNSGSHAPHVPRFFWWEGPDGSRLLTFYSPGGYGTPLLPPADWPYDTWLSVQQTVDNHGPHTPEELKRIRRTIEEGAPGTEIVFGQLGDFSDSLFESPDQLADLPVVPYDLADTWIHGVGTMPREVARVRELRAKLLELECAVAFHDWPVDASFSADFPVSRSIAPLIDSAYEQLLLFGEHTWGLDVKSTIKRAYGDAFAAARETGSYRRLESSWVAKAAYVGKAEALYGQALELAQAAGVDLEASSVWSSAGVAESVEDASLPDNVLENDFYRLEVDPAAGGITSLIDKRNGHEWADPKSREPFGGYRYDIYSVVDIAEFMRSYGLYFQDWFVQDFGKQGYPEDSQHITAYARNFTLSKSGQTITLTNGKLEPTATPYIDVPKQTISIKISLTGSAFIDLEYTVEGKEATPLAESTVVPLGLNLRKPAFRLKQTGSVIDPARDVVSGANRNLWCADWLDVTDDRIGFALFPVDMPLVSIGDPGIYRFEPERTPTESTVYAHLSNTQWGTNFPQWLEGDFSWRVRLVAHEGDWRSSMLWFKSDVSRIPFQTPLGIELQSVRPRHDGPGLIARFWNSQGLHNAHPLVINGPIKAIRRCDLQERPLEQLPLLTSDEPGPTLADVHSAPHSIITLLIEFGET